MSWDLFGPEVWVLILMVIAYIVFVYYSSSKQKEKASTSDQLQDKALDILVRRMERNQSEKNEDPSLSTLGPIAATVGFQNLMDSASSWSGWKLTLIFLGFAFAMRWFKQCDGGDGDGNSECQNDDDQAQSSDGTGIDLSSSSGLGSATKETASNKTPWYEQTYDYTYGYTPYQIAVAIMGALILVLSGYGVYKASCCRATAAAVVQAEQDAEAGAIAIQNVRNGMTALTNIATVGTGTGIGSGGGGSGGANAV